jgi:hypothetical protein
MAECRTTVRHKSRIQEYCKPFQQYEGVLQAFIAELRSTASLYSSIRSTANLYGRIQEYSKPLQQYKEYSKPLWPNSGVLQAFTAV